MLLIFCKALTLNHELWETFFSTRTQLILAKSRLFLTQFSSFDLIPNHENFTTTSFSHFKIKELNFSSALNFIFVNQVQ